MKDCCATCCKTENHTFCAAFEMVKKERWWHLSADPTKHICNYYLGRKAYDPPVLSQVVQEEGRKEER